MTIHVLGCLGVAAFTYLAYALAAAVRPSPWWNPQYSIPTLGLMLGNAVTGVAVGLGTLLDELGRGSGGDGVELMLCLGASRWEASRGAVGRAAKLAMTPILNQLSVVGLVWIPGMMTGQMIAGADPAQAARYQMVVMFIVSATTVSAAAAVVCLAAATLVDAQARLRRDRLSERQRGGGFAAQAWKRVARVWAEWRAGGRRRPVDGREGSPLL
jgi:putative ABC transport system permease protein